MAYYLTDVSANDTRRKFLKPDRFVSPGSTGGTSNSASQYATNKQSTAITPYQQQLDDIYNKINSREKFNYNMNGDSLYKQYADRYAQNAKLAMQDTVGQASALTGGYGNSYAATAGQAMYNQQMSGLNDKALELYQLALDRYNSEGNDLLNQYGLASDRYNTEYGKLRDAVADDQWGKSFAENQRQYNDGMAYDRERAGASDAQWAQEFAEGKRQYNQSLSENSRQYDQSMAYDRERAGASDSQWAQEYAENKRQYNGNMDYQQGRDTVSDAQWNKEFGENQRQYNANMSYQQNRDAAGDTQWQKSFDYAKSRDTAADQKEAAATAAAKQAQIVANAKDFKSTIMTADEYDKSIHWYNKGDKDYGAYVEKTITDAVDNGEISEEEGAYLFALYNL